MPYLSKVKLNGIVYNLKDSEAHILATETNNGLMSAEDKRMINNLNPNVTVTLSDLNASDFSVINAKQLDALSMKIAVEPVIQEQIRTSNLLDVNTYTSGYYIGSNGQLASNANDQVGDFIPVTPGDDIYYTGIIGATNSSSINRRLHVYNANKTWIRQVSFAANLRVGDSWSTHGVIPSNGAYVRVSWGTNDTHVMLSVGSPIKYQPYYITPFGKITGATFAVGPTSDRSEATEYAITVPAAAGDLYGFSYDPIAGKIYQSTGHIDSYDGETLPGAWWSDRDVYIEGNSPSEGAEVIYKFNDEDIIEHNITPLTIPLNYHVNYFFTDGGYFKEITYYAETFGVEHITINTGMTYGSTNVLESDLIEWTRAASLIDEKANINSPNFTGVATAPTLAITNNTDRIATTAFVQSQLHTLAPYENGAKATRNYVAGDYLTYAGNLYKVTAAIATNTSLTVGTNVEITDVATELNALRALIQ